MKTTQAATCFSVFRSAIVEIEVGSRQNNVYERNSAEFAKTFGKFFDAVWSNDRPSFIRVAVEAQVFYRRVLMKNESVGNV